MRLLLATEVGRRHRKSVSPASNIYVYLAVCPTCRFEVAFSEDHVGCSDSWGERETGATRQPIGQPSEGDGAPGFAKSYATCMTGRANDSALVIGGLAIAGLGGSAIAYAPAAATIAIAVAVAGFWTFLCAWRPATAVVVVVAMVLFSSHLLAVAYAAGAPAGLVRNTILLKDAAAWSLVLVLVFRRVASVDVRPVLYLAGYITIVVSWFAALQAPVGVLPAFAAIRGALVPVVALAIAALLTSDERASVVPRSIQLGIAAAIYGVVETLILPASWQTVVVNVGAYWSDVKGASLFLDPATGLPGNFFTAQGYPRLTGPFGDPLSAGMVLASLLVLALAYRQELRRPWFAIGVLGFALLLTFTRGGWILAAMGGAGVLIAQIGVAKAAARLIPAAMAAMLFSYSFAPIREYISGIMNGRDGSTLAHQAALAKSFSADVSMTGSGWGTGGAVALANGVESAVSTESTLVALATQIGIAGLGLLLLMLLGLGWRKNLGAAALGLWVALFVSSLTSENLLAFNAGFVPFLILGLLPTNVRVTRRVDRLHRSIGEPRQLVTDCLYGEHRKG